MLAWGLLRGLQANHPKSGSSVFNNYPQVTFLFPWRLRGPVKGHSPRPRGTWQCRSQEGTQGRGWAGRRRSWKSWQFLSWCWAEDSGCSTFLLLTEKCPQRNSTPSRCLLQWERQRKEIPGVSGWQDRALWKSHQIRNIGKVRTSKKWNCSTLWNIWSAQVSGDFCKSWHFKIITVHWFLSYYVICLWQKVAKTQKSVKK